MCLKGKVVADEQPENSWCCRSDRRQVVVQIQLIINLSIIVGRHPIRLSVCVMLLVNLPAPIATGQITGVALRTKQF